MNKLLYSKTIISFPVFLLFLPALVAAQLTLTDAGAGLDRTVTVESKGQFRLVFENADNWGIAQWYDLVNDSGATTNLAFSDFQDPGVREAGLFQQVYYGTNPDDPKLYHGAAKYYQPNAERSFTIFENTPSRIVVKAVSHPLLHAGVLTNVTVAVEYYIFSNGKMYITSRMSATNAQTINEWRCAVIGLCDPQNNAGNCPGGYNGWVRCAASQMPYDWNESVEKYLFAYWNPATPAPYTTWTKASVLLVPIDRTSNRYMNSQGCHGWSGFKRFVYRGYSITMAAGDTITHKYLMQLGAQNSAVLPNLVDTAICNPIADAYIKNPNPPGGPVGIEGGVTSYTSSDNLAFVECGAAFVRVAVPISFVIPDLRQNAFVRLAVYTINGQQLEVLVNTALKPGIHTVVWNPRSRGSGIYVFKLICLDRSIMQKRFLLK